MDIIPSSLSCINEMIGGGYDTENISAFFAEQGTCKSLLCLQEAYYLASKTKRPVLYIDTEGGVIRMNAVWEEVFMNRFGVDNKKSLIFKKLRSIEELMWYHGIDVSMDIKGAKEVSMKKAQKKFDDTPIVKDIKKFKIAAVVYDSATAPFTTEFGSITQNLPARSDSMGFFLNRVLAIMDNTEVMVFMTHHASVNPQKPFEREKIKGGATIQYFSKIQFALKKYPSTQNKNFRKIHLARFPNAPAWEKMALLEITDTGLYDIDETTRKEKVKQAKGCTEDE